MYTEDICKARLIVHTNPSRKRSSNLRNLKTPAFRFRVNGKHFENGAFRKRRRHNIITWFPERVFLKHKSKIICYCCIFYILPVRCPRKTFDALFIVRAPFSISSGLVGTGPFIWLYWYWHWFPMAGEMDDISDTSDTFDASDEITRRFYRGKLCISVYTTQVNSADWLARRWLAKYYSPPLRWIIVNYILCLFSLLILLGA